MSTLDDILESVIAPDTGDFSSDLAKYILTMRFSDERVAQYEVLTEKNQGGQITPEEREQLEAFVTANTLLMILKSKARRSLIQHSSAA
jgi:hypothetical protein